MTVEEACLVLGIEKTNITEEELKHCYYNAAHLSHPDSNPYNEYAKNKFAMIEEAYLVLKGYVIKLPKNRAQTSTSKDKTKKSTYSNKSTSAKRDSSNQGPDPWEAFNEADRKFAQMKRDQAKAKAKEAFARKEREDRRQSQESQRVNHKGQAPFREASYSAAAMKKAQAIPQVSDISPTMLLKEKFQVFLEKDLVFDSLLALFVATLMLSLVFSLPFIGQLSAWGLAVLTARRIGKLVFNRKSNLLYAFLAFLVCIELLMILFQLFIL